MKNSVYWAVKKLPSSLGFSLSANHKPASIPSHGGPASGPDMCFPNTLKSLNSFSTSSTMNSVVPSTKIEMKHELVEYDFRLIQVCTTISCEYFLCQLTYVFMNPFSFNFQWKSEPVSTFFATMLCGVRSFSSSHALAVPLQAPA